MSCLIDGRRLEWSREHSELERLGLRRGERIAIDLSVETLPLALAALKLGALVCPMSPRLAPLERTKRLERLAPRFVVSAETIEERPATPKALDGPGFLLFTSGTTAEPKIAVLPLDRVLHSAQVAAHALELRDGDEWLLSLPLHHVGGLGIVFRCLVADAKLSTRGRTYTHMSCVPTQLYRAWPASKRLKCLLLGGAPIRDVPSALPVVTSYGMTETSSLIIADGKLLPGAEARIAEDGELLVRGKTLFSGYWTGTRLETPFDETGWFATGDLAVWSPTSGYSIVGRKDNQFISGGENIQPEEIERALCEHPAVLDVVVVPREDAEWGARPVAFVRSREKVTLEELRAFLGERLARYKLPVALFELPEMEGKAPRLIERLTKTEA